MKRLLVVFAHPDDEAFGPGGTLAKYARSGVEIHLLCATRGEGGENEIKDQKAKIKKHKKLGEIREKELLKSAEILGIKKVEFLGFEDGHLCNAIYHEMADAIIKKINDFKPQVIMTEERRGVSGHLDHVACSMITTYAYQKTKYPSKLYYQCLSKKNTNVRKMDYFIYFPEGYSEEEITTRIDYKDFWKIKRKAMMAHKSQWKDVIALLAFYTFWPKIDNFILQYHRGIKVKLPETDLFAGIEG